MIKFILMILFAIFGAFLLIKMVTYFIPFVIAGGGLYLGYRWMDKNLKLGEEKTTEAKEEVKEVEVKVIEEEPKPLEEPKSLEERIERLKEGASE